MGKISNAIIMSKISNNTMISDNCRCGHEHFELKHILPEMFSECNLCDCPGTAFWFSNVILYNHVTYSKDND